MSFTPNVLERLHDHGLFLFRAAAGGSLVFFGAAVLAEGRVAWAQLGAAMNLPPAEPMPVVAGFAAAALTTVGGALLVLGLWTRLAALGMGCVMAVAAMLRWPAVRSGTLEGAAAVFYPATMVAALWALATLGGGRFGVDAVYRARVKRKARRGGS